MQHLLFTLPRAEAQAASFLERTLQFEQGVWSSAFDGTMRISSIVKNRHVMIVSAEIISTEQVYEATALASALKKAGAKSVGLLSSRIPTSIADIEAIRLISVTFDWIATIDTVNTQHYTISIIPIPTENIQNGEYPPYSVFPIESFLAPRLFKEWEYYELGENHILRIYDNGSIEHSFVDDTGDAGNFIGEYARTTYAYQDFLNARPETVPEDVWAEAKKIIIEKIVPQLKQG